MSETDAVTQAARRLLSDVNPRRRRTPGSMLADDIRIVASSVLHRSAARVEEPVRPLQPTAIAGDYEAGMRWMCDDGSMWETRWDARDQQWVWALVSVPVKQEGEQP